MFLALNYLFLISLDFQTWEMVNYTFVLNDELIIDNIFLHIWFPCSLFLKAGHNTWILYFLKVQLQSAAFGTQL